MACPDRLSQWSQEVSMAFGHLSKPHVWGLVLWSAGIALTGTAGLTQISALLALVLQQGEQTVKQRLREWYLEASHTSGSELEVTQCFAPLLRWIVRLWRANQMVLVLDATSVRDQWTVLAVSWVPQPGTHWKGEVDCFAGQASRITATLLLRWERGYEHPWIVLTDLAPEEAEISWYGLRTWIETGFKDFKRGLWDWHHSKMVSASWVERHWVTLALAQLWAVSMRCQVEVQAQEQERGAGLSATHIARLRRKQAQGESSPRSLSVRCADGWSCWPPCFKGKRACPVETWNPKFGRKPFALLARCPQLRNCMNASADASTNARGEHVNALLPDGRQKTYT